MDENELITNDINEEYTCGYAGRLKRLKFLYKLENKMLGFLFAEPTYSYYYEARMCWYNGEFISTIIMVQLALEEALRSKYRLIYSKQNDKRKKLDKMQFFELIHLAESDGFISSKEANNLHFFRAKIRNPYVHVKDIEDTNDKSKIFGTPNYISQTFKINARNFASMGGLRPSHSIVNFTKNGRAQVGKDLSRLVITSTENEAKISIKLLINLIPKILLATEFA